MGVKPLFVVHIGYEADHPVMGEGPYYSADKCWQGVSLENADKMVKKRAERVRAHLAGIRQGFHPSVVSLEKAKEIGKCIRESSILVIKW